MEAAVQLLIITPDVESTVALVAGAFAHFGVQGIDVMPATSAQRTARLLRTEPARAVAGPPNVLRELVSASALRLDSVRGTVFAWVDEVIEEGLTSLLDLEAVLAETPKDAIRVLVTREMTSAIEQFVQRHLPHARSMGKTGAAVAFEIPTAYVTTTLAARPSALRRVLDQLDPPSAAVVVRTEESESEARVALRQLGYRRADDIVQVTRGEAPANVHTVILYDPPVGGDLLALVSRSNPTQIVSLVEAADVKTLKRLSGNRAFPLPPAQRPSRERLSDELLRKELRALLDAGLGAREVAAIEPLLAEYDVGEIAGALVRLLERERERGSTVQEAPPIEPRAGGFRGQRDQGTRSFSTDRPRDGAQRGGRGFGRERPRSSESGRGFSGGRPRSGGTGRGRRDEGTGRGERGGPKR